MEQVKFNFAGKVAIVTGGGTGIGKSISLEFAKAGADVVVASRKLPNLEKVAADIRALGRRALAVTTDVRVPEQVENMVKQTVDTFGRIDILVNNAGASFRCPVEDLSPNGWDAVVDTNLKGTFMCSRAAGKVMIKQNACKIVNISSMNGVYGSPWASPYGASKAGIINLTRCMAVEWAKYNIAVNCIAPGFILTEGIARVRPPEDLKARAQEMLYGRLGEVGEIASITLFLASDGASYIIGQTIIADGGYGLARK